jgi:hypothetical protein
VTSRYASFVASERDGACSSRAGRRYADERRERELARIGGADTPVESEAKPALIAALDRLRTAHADDASALWIEVDQAEALLEGESDKKIQDYERRRGAEPA